MWAPDTASYGYDSRAASIRILSAPGVPLPATRFEVRVPGADVSYSLLILTCLHSSVYKFTSTIPLPTPPRE
jgi:glutamine synthetase